MTLDADSRRPIPSASAPPTGWAALGCLVLAAALYRASMTEDAFITLRVLDNLLAGHGLRYAPEERVQVFTHPLWALLAVPFVWAFEDPKWALTWLGLLCTGGAFIWAAWPHRHRPGLIAIAVAGPWLASESLLRYSTTGLENSLSHLCIAWFAWTLLYRDAPGRTPWGQLTLAASLATMNRLDASLLFAPACLWLAVRARGRLPMARVALAATPLLGWLLFATVYFGSPVPNTAAAKLPPSVDWPARVAQGFGYLQTLAVYDLVSAIWLGLGFGVTATSLHSARATVTAKVTARATAPPETTHAGPTTLAALGLGGVAHAGYVIAIGGDYLSGRFWSPSVFVGLCTVAAAAAPYWDRLGRRTRASLVLLAAPVLAVACLPRAHAPQDPKVMLRHVQTRAPIHYDLGLATGAPVWRPSPGAEFALELERRMLAQHRAKGTEPRVLLARACGLLPFSAGPELRVVDALGITDPLMARIRPECPSRFRPGHNPRVPPPGYLHARRTGSLERMPPGLRRYYRMLRELTRGPLLSRARLAAFWQFHSGQNDHLLAAYNSSLIPNCREPIME